MAGKKRVDPIKQREKRAKIAAGIGCALFLIVGIIEVPSMMAMMNKKPPPGADATDAGNRAADGSIPLPNVAIRSGLSDNGELANTDVPPTPDGAQLVSFTVFDTKNPFIPQGTTPLTNVPDAPGAATQPTSGAPPGTTTTSITPTTTTPTSTTSVVPGSPGSPTGTTQTTTTVAPPTVAISVNGVVAHVGSQGTFPTGAAVFRLVSYTKDSAQIGIVGGSYASGGATLTLQLGKPVTLQNTTDHKTYKLELVATH